VLKNYPIKKTELTNYFIKGVYSPEARELARTLVAAGCSREYVAE